METAQDHVDRRRRRPTRRVDGVVHLHDLWRTRDDSELRDDTDRRRAIACARIKLLLFDVDGVLTDGTILLHADGTESKAFDIRDGTAMVWAQRAGLTVGLLSARSSAATAQRAAQLGITLVVQGVGRQARRATSRSCATPALDRRRGRLHGRRPARPAGAARASGFSAAPADAAAEVRAARALGQRQRAAGAARRASCIELILRAQGRWRRRRRRLPGRSGRRMSRYAPLLVGARRAARSASPSARRGSATSCRTASGSIAAARASRRTTCSA